MKKNRQGAAAVEFAITAPILFLLMATIFEFGWFVVIKHTADNAAYEATRRAIVPGGTVQDANEEASRMMRMVGAQSFDVAVDPANIDFDTREVEVIVSGLASENGIIASRFLGGVQFNSEVKLLTERPRRD
ncbi:MAG: TadE family protein [Planctomycetota bacterium]